MKKYLILFVSAIISLNIFSQVTFEPGYFINEDNERIECLIKNDDKKNNPIDFNYKFSEEGESKIGTIASINEFGIDGTLKYLRTTVEIDRSSKKTEELSNKSEPIFKEEQLFLKVIIEGNANLYSYQDGMLIRYFYSIDGAEIQQLVYKKYKSGVLINENIHFKKQLANDLNCSNLESSLIDKIQYKRKSLSKYFVDYHNCSSADFVSFNENKRRDKFNITLRPRIKNASLSVSNSSSLNGDIDFPNKSIYGLGIEVEFILPFNRNKWALIMEPSVFQKYLNEKATELALISGGDFITLANYSSIEIPVSLRYYMFLSKKTKTFLNASYVLAYSSNSYLEYNFTENGRVRTIDMEPKPNFAFGFGIKHSRLSVELRYNTSRNLFRSFTYGADYNSISLILGYSIIQK